MKILLEQNCVKKESGARELQNLVFVLVAGCYLFFHKTVERNFLLYSEASVDDQTGVCVAEESKAGRQAVALSSAGHSMT